MIKPQEMFDPCLVNPVRMCLYCTLPGTPLWAATYCSESRPSAFPWRWERTQWQERRSLRTDKPPGWRRGWTRTAPGRQMAGGNSHTFAKRPSTAFTSVPTVNCPLMKNNSEFNYCCWMLTNSNHRQTFFTLPYPQTAIVSRQKIVYKMG